MKSIDTLKSPTVSRLSLKRFGLLAGLVGTLALTGCATEGYYNGGYTSAYTTTPYVSSVSSTYYDSGISTYNSYPYGYNGYGGYGAYNYTTPIYTTPNVFIYSDRGNRNWRQGTPGYARPGWPYRGNNGANWNRGNRAFTPGVAGPRPSFNQGQRGFGARSGGNVGGVRGGGGNHGGGGHGHR